MKVKRRLNDIMQQTLEPIRERRLMFEKDKAEVLNMLKKGSESARPIAAETLNKLKEVFKRIVSEWLPANSYEIKDAPEISVYHWFPKYAKEERYIEIWLPIEKAER